MRTALGSNKSDKLKSYDLVWLLHLVGDAHQPLHSATRVSSNEHDGDNGGNNVKLCANCKDELHAFWDGLPGDSAKPVAAVTYARGLPPADPTLAAKNHESDWIQESFIIAQQVVYTPPSDWATALSPSRQRIKTTHRRSLRKELHWPVNGWPT